MSCSSLSYTMFTKVAKYASALRRRCREFQFFELLNQSKVDRLEICGEPLISPVNSFGAVRYALAVTIRPVKATTITIYPRRKAFMGEHRHSRHKDVTGFEAFMAQIVGAPYVDTIIRTGRMSQSKR